MHIFHQSCRQRTIRRMLHMCGLPSTTRLWVLQHFSRCSQSKKFGDYARFATKHGGFECIFWHRAVKRSESRFLWCSTHWYTDWRTLRLWLKYVHLLCALEVITSVCRSALPENKLIPVSRKAHDHRVRVGFNNRCNSRSPSCCAWFLALSWRSKAAFLTGGEW